jgi:hypothetical protein
MIQLAGSTVTETDVMTSTTLNRTASRLATALQMEAKLPTTPAAPAEEASLEEMSV